MKHIAKSLMKRTFDIFLAVVGLLLTSWLIIFAWIVASIETKSNGFFFQHRIGRFGKPFRLIKIKTMRDLSVSETGTSIASINVSRITYFGRHFRRFKIDELPQFWNILVGEMSFVGPRPDVAGYADKLVGEERKILELLPGITGPASIKYKCEEAILSTVSNPQQYNDEVIWPDKIRLNLEYYYNHSIVLDTYYIFRTIVSK